MSLKRATGTTMRAAALDRFGGVETIQMKTLGKLALRAQ
jgi:hypothetical protein